MPTPLTMASYKATAACMLLGDLMLGWMLQIYAPYIRAGKRVPANEVVCVLDADHKVAAEFFKTLTPLFDRGDDVAMVRPSTTIC